MHLGIDHVHPTPGRGRCRVRIFVPDEAEPGERLGDRHVVVCSEVADNAGEGVTKAAERIYKSVRETFRLVDPVWIEHV